MKKAKGFLKKKPYLALTVPAVLCSITFVTNFFKALSDGNIDSTELHGLLASADGFEATIMFMVMLALKNKKK